eukprot:CAMPEP_0206193202 /NCGR_PEP_ID=MMETSP0166-20121206/6426_1 /ASSEMBLY_ACC=CAM_ASM_000260 /TAXON_ID=95228 /ORGANISM="Vannella robusta, Strain DIVA3 518/3/11/1/6" /LENGTH=89 /DNA_ID=CAMNT_0053609869 /DNA_START=223 /DNA_END=492 /DNA_ORIENTATION=-
MSPVQLCISAVAAYDNYFLSMNPADMIVARELNTVIGTATFNGSINGTEFTYLFVISAEVKLSDQPKNLSPQVISARIYYDTEFVSNLF